MTHTTNDAPVTVEQCDRDAAWPFAPCAGTAADIAGGRGDWLPVVQAFARHRLAASAPAGWIVGNGDGTKWRTWGLYGSEWTDDRDKATRYARRVDAEKVHAEDEDAWTIQPYAASAPAGDGGGDAARVVSALKEIMTYVNRGHIEGDCSFCVAALEEGEQALAAYTAAALARPRAAVGEREA